MDIAPGWQGRADKLRELIRTCEHRGERLTNPHGQIYCAQCCLHLSSDHIRNLLIDWMANHSRTADQPPETIPSDALGLIDDFERAIRHEEKT